MEAPRPLSPVCWEDVLDRDEHELFERMDDGSLNWRGLVRGLQSAQVTLSLLADQTNHECFAMDSTGTAIMLSRTPLRGARRILQIAYSKALLTARAQRLRREAYDVTSVYGNRAARSVLRLSLPYDLFVLDHGAAEAVRRELVTWLRTRYPRTRILALNEPGQTLVELRYNAPSEPEAAWLPIIPRAMAESAAAI